MNVEYAFLCDYADPTSAKFTAVGIGIDTINTAAVPAVHSHFFTVLAVRFTANESGRPKKFAMYVQDADAKDIIPPLSNDVEIPPCPEGHTSRTHRFVNGLYMVRFEKFGSYQVSWLIDGTEVHALPFHVVPPDSPTPAGGGG